MKLEESTKLNEMQQFTVKQFDRQLSVERQTEIKQLLSDYFAKLVDEEIDQIWEQRRMTQQDLDEALKTHHRTPYRR